MAQPHIQILQKALLAANVKLYLKVGTAGTGGMGLNIPYTHSEERPSRVLLAKSAVAGAQSLLLFLMARTPDGPVIKEIKPTAAIAWKKIAYDTSKYVGARSKVLMVDKVRTALPNFKPRELFEGLKETIGWCEEHLSSL